MVTKLHDDKLREMELEPEPESSLSDYDDHYEQRSEVAEITTSGANEVYTRKTPSIHGQDSKTRKRRSIRDVKGKEEDTSIQATSVRSNN